MLLFQNVNNNSKIFKKYPGHKWSGFVYPSTRSPHPPHRACHRPLTRFTCAVLPHSGHLKCDLPCVTASNAAVQNFTAFSMS